MMPKPDERYANGVHMVEQYAWDFIEAPGPLNYYECRGCQMTAEPNVAAADRPHVEGCEVWRFLLAARGWMEEAEEEEKEKADAV